MTTLLDSLQRESYEFCRYKEFINDSRLTKCKILKNNKGEGYVNVPCAFDIETTSFLYNGDKCAIMYEWTIGINGLVLYGRTWEQFIEFYDYLVDYYKPDKKSIIVIYVHNLSFEFQFLQKRLEWLQVFALDSRKPVKARTKDYIEFRCSYQLSGYSLAKLSEQLTKYKCQKLVGDLDYSLLRHSKTPLTEKELGYCINDVKVVMCYIQEKIEQSNGIQNLPLTKTGYVRNYCRKQCFYDGLSEKEGEKTHKKYSLLMKSLTLDAEEYMELKRAFAGGFTHANAFYAGTIIENVKSYDFTSSYPTVMVAEKFPMSKGERVNQLTEEEFKKNIDKYCCLFDLELFNLTTKCWADNPISLSRCTICKKAVINNGRVVSAEYIKTTVTEQDYKTLKLFYDWDEMKVSNFIRYRKGYLPTNFVKTVLKFYEDKTTLKGVDGKEVEYLNSKEMVNALYGMIVTDICRNEIIYTDEWTEKEVDIEKAINKYNKSKNRFLFYPWGVWITAYARRNLFTGIYEFQDDYIYADTDSIKVCNYQNHEDYIKSYNNWITKKLEDAVEYHGIDKSKIRPLTIKGEEKPLGVWDDEGCYEKFKTLGAKRYMVQKNGKINITVSGLNKKVCVPYLLEKYGDNVFDEFKNGLYVPPQYTGKNVHTYIDIEMFGYITDYLGDRNTFHEYSSVHLCECDYSLGLSSEFADYLMKIKEQRK